MIRVELDDQELSLLIRAISASRLFVEREQCSEFSDEEILELKKLAQKLDQQSREVPNGDSDGITGGGAVCKPADNVSVAGRDTPRDDSQGSVDGGDDNKSSA